MHYLTSADPLSPRRQGKGSEMRDLILPPLRRTSLEAAQFASTVHAGQTDKAGKEYVHHLRRVAIGVRKAAQGCPFWDSWDLDEASQIAWLHDTVEDAGVSGPDLDREGFSQAVLHGVLLLSNLGKRPYATFIGNVVEYGSLAVILVKLADVEDNSDSERIAMLDDASRERLTKKYAGAADILREAARKKGWQG